MKLKIKMFNTKKGDYKKQIRHLKAMLNQVNAYRVVTDYCKEWKQKRKSEIKQEIYKLKLLQEET